MTPEPRNLFVVAALVGVAGCTSRPARDTARPLPWSRPELEWRQVFGVEASALRQAPLVDLPVAEHCEGTPVVQDAETGTRLTAHREPNGIVRVQIPGTVTPGQSRRVVAYWSQRAGWTGDTDPAAFEPPSDDYAVVRYGDAWDFDEGDLENIRSWGNRPTEYGEVTVRNGRLVIPVTGNDPYFIWGVMFGNPDHQPPGHGDQPREAIDSAVYTVLRMRIRQTCPTAAWSVFVTDADGAYRAHDFHVTGTDDQTLCFDLRTLFEGFWDGRMFRALRIDTTNDRPGVTAEVDWVRLERPPCTVQAGPVLSRAQIAARAAAAAAQADVPASTVAGSPVNVRIKVTDPAGNPVRYAPVTAVLEPASQSVGRAETDGEGRALIQLRAGHSAGTARWAAGLCGDMGSTPENAVRGALTVLPGVLHHYEITPEKAFVPVGEPEIELTVWGADAFGNRLPVDVPAPHWIASGGALLPDTPLSGAPATVTMRCSQSALTRHRVQLVTTAGISGRTTVTTLRFRDRQTVVLANGCLALNGETLFLPLGGFYANWPAGQPDEHGTVSRSVDLFPCNATPYPHGFPWTEDVETKVRNYLALCENHGVTALRLMFRNMDLVGKVDPVQLEAVLHLFDLARPHGIRFNIVLFEDYNKPPYVNEGILETIVLPCYTPEELAALPPHRRRFLVDRKVLPQPAMRYTDADAMACQKDYLKEVIPVLAGRDEVFCYEFENEMVHPPMEWVRTMAAAIRRIDPHTPILGNPGPHAWPEPWRWRNSTADLFSYHPYNDGVAQADHGAVVFMRSKWAAAAGIPFFTGEGGINQNRWQAEVQKVGVPYAARGIRDQVWLSICTGACGAFMWTPGHIAEMAEFGKVTTALEALNINLKTLHRRTPATCLAMPMNASCNNRAYALAYTLLEMGVDFDVRPAGASDGYAVVIGTAVTTPEALRTARPLVAPLTGYQAAVLPDASLNQVLVYVRNVAGAIRSHGVKRPCHLREPGPADAVLILAPELRNHRAAAFDLDLGSTMPAMSPAGNRLTIAQQSTHDFVVALTVRPDN